MKLFQIEEPDGTPAEVDGPGLAIGISLDGVQATVALAVGGNAEALPAPDGASGPATAGLRGPDGRFDAPALAAAFAALRMRAERALARPVTHAAVAVPLPVGADDEATLFAAAQSAGLTVTRILGAPEATALAGSDKPDAALLGAAIAAEDDGARLMAPGERNEILQS